METLYRKVAVSEMKIMDKSPLFLVQIIGAKNQRLPNDKNDWQFYLEEIPDNEIKLQKDKEEFAIQILKKLKTKLDNMGMWSYCDKTAFDEEIESLIQKHKS